MKTGDLGTFLTHFTREGELYSKLPDGKVQCFSCGHRCLISEGESGICRVRFNQKGALRVPAGYVAGLQADPVEKKPFYHVLPGAKALSFGMLGCDFHCPYCQNWLTSQTLQDARAGILPETIRPEEIIEIGKKYRAKIVTSTYNEPLITSEWAAEIFDLAKREGFLTAYVSNGNGTPEVLDYLRPRLDLFKVDLKSFSEKAYRTLGGRLSTVLDTIRMLKERNFWVEVVTLVIPEFNDSEEELGRIADFLASVSVDIPWHVTAFHGDYRMRGPGNTSPEMLLEAAEIGKRSGLRFVYAGNLTGRVRGLENTYCPSCRELLVERSGFSVLTNRITGGNCPKCGTGIPGIWE
ncbi:MAG TPA: AmmeMemoRadiSam system radical SAM enzyme [Candidatus Omnitrophota bacterium]|nr:AmmeMemoRadiSam system radical SAM enzyme [Candidatus Omnitrophota bacterium]